MGFSHIFIYDNNASDYESVENCIDSNIKDKITIFKEYQNISKRGLQMEIYNKFYSEYSNEYDWIAFFDVDEFLTGVENINSFLDQDKFNDYCQIIIKWRLFGDDDIIERDESIPVFEFFKKENTTSPINLRNSVKCIVRGKSDIEFLNVHWAKGKNAGCLPSGKPLISNAFYVTDSMYQDETVFLNHYRTKTLSEFIKYKLIRGDWVFMGTFYSLNYYWEQNEQTDEKLKWLDENYPELAHSFYRKPFFTNKLKKCFGIISGFPEKDSTGNRERRINRFNQLLSQLNDYWPQIDILIISQNWQDYTLPKIKNKIIRIDFEKNIGILNARNVLREEFLKRDYEYIIMMDDDDIIQCNQKYAYIDYMNVIDCHPQGFAFVKGQSAWFKDYPYAPAPLNLCAVSRFIYEKEPIPDVNLQKSEALEDDVYAYLLHCKYHEYEFNFPSTIKHTQFKLGQYEKQFREPDKYLPSTWNRGEINNRRLTKNTLYLLNYIKENKELPNMEEWHKQDNEKWEVK